MADGNQQILRMAKRLFTLEVNTILKEQILATTMPATVHALLDIARDYDIKLIEVAGPSSNPKLREKGYATLEQFDDLRTRAVQATEKVEQGQPLAGAKPEALTDPDLRRVNLLMLARIADNCDQLKGIFQGLQRRGFKFPPEEMLTRAATEHGSDDFPLTPEEQVILSKIWEIGLEEIAMQTVIQLDGDVTTRIQPKHATEAARVIREIHAGAVQTSVSFWKSLVEIAGAVARTTVELLEQLVK